MSQINTPFAYNVGINYESWDTNNSSNRIIDDIAFIANYFSLIKTFHCAAVGLPTSNPCGNNSATIAIDPTQSYVIQAIVKHTSKTLELIMGTNVSSLSMPYGRSWTPGCMTLTGYSDKWVEMIIKAFGSKQAVLKHLKCISLGNEIDQSGPVKGSSNFVNYYKNWIPQAFKNLEQSLSKKGLDTIPITTTIANYPSVASANVVASYTVSYINSNWSSKWNSGKPFVFFNQYTANNQTSTNFATVPKYLKSLKNTLLGAPQVFVGETGYSAAHGSASQISVIDQLFAWLHKQYTHGGKTIPLCVFQAFDRPNKEYGLFKYNTQGKRVLKQNIKIPQWINKHI